MAANEISTNNASTRVVGGDWMELVARQVGSLRYGVIQIIVHDGRVIQIEKTEKARLERPQP